MDLENATIVTNDTKPGYEYSACDYVVGVGIPILAGIAVLFNLVTLLVMHIFFGKIRSYYVLIVVQCSADLLASFAYLAFYLVPNYVNQLLPPPRGIHYCITRFFTDMINGSFALSLMNVLAITLDRFVAVHSPLKYPTVARTSRMKIIAVVMALISLILSCIPIVGTITKANAGNLTFCDAYYHAYSVTYQFVNVLIVLDTLVMIGAYSYILDQVRRRPVSQCSTRSTYHTTVTSFWIVATFMICYWPDIITMYVEFPYSIVYLIKSLVLLNCIADPIIYAIRLRKIKLGFRKLYSKIRGSSESNTRTSKMNLEE